MRASVVVPCYDEERNIPLLLERFSQAMAAEGIGAGEMEVILVDNGSTDGTPVLLERLLHRYPFARSVRVEVNQGYGHGILAGLDVAKGDFLGWTHADMQTDPADVVRAFRLLEAQDWDRDLFVKGKRIGRRWSERFFTFGMGVFETLYLGQRLSDINAQPNMFSRRFFEGWEHPPRDFSLDLYAFWLARERGLRVLRFPVRFPPRIHGASHWDTGLASKVGLIRRTIAYSVGLKREMRT